MSIELDLRVKTASLIRMLNLQGVIGMFGHVSIRIPDTDLCFISPGASTEKSTVRPEDVFLYNIDGSIVEHPGGLIPLEWRIHTQIHRDRPDAMCVCHLHGPAARALAIAGKPLKPVFLHGAFLCTGVPTWDNPRLVVADEQAADLSRTLGHHCAAQMRGHGSVVVGASPEEAFSTRFAGFASLPTPAPDKAAEELDRCISKLGFKGANINGHARGRYLDDVFFAPILERAEALGVPIYLHPTVPPKAVVEALYSGFSPAVSGVFASGGWGWHIETAVHVLRMVLGGVFDRHPKLQVMIGHLGEGIPFMLPRLNRNLPAQMTKLQRPVADYLRQNLHYTFGGFNFMPTFLNLLLEVGVDRIMFSIDYPYCAMQESRAFLEYLPVSETDRVRIAYENADRLLKL